MEDNSKEQEKTTTINELEEKLKGQIPKGCEFLLMLGSENVQSLAYSTPQYMIGCAVEILIMRLGQYMVGELGHQHPWLLELAEMLSRYGMAKEPLGQETKE